MRQIGRVGAVLTVLLAAAAACGPSDMDGSGNAAGALAGAEADGAPAIEATKAQHEAELMRLEREFSAASQRDGAAAWSSRWAPNGRMWAGGAERIGPEAVGEAMAPMLERTGARFAWAPDTAVVAASGDLGYTLGHYWILGEGAQAADTVARGNYVTIWQRQADGSWKIAVDIGT